MSLLIDSTGVVSAMLNDALTQYVRDRFLSAGGNSPATVTEVTTLENEQALQPKQAAPQVAASALGSGVPNPVLHMFDSSNARLLERREGQSLGTEQNFRCIREALFDWDHPRNKTIRCGAE
jgi:hypothetical protein